MPMTLVEASKLDASNFLRSGILQMYAETSPILRVLPFVTIDARSYTYNREETLPGVGFRGINEGFTEGVGVLNPQTETLAISGGDLDFDRQLLRTGSADLRGVHVGMKIRALALAWTSTFIKGDTATAPRTFDGLQVRLVGDQLIDNTTAAGGGPLSLAKLDKLIDSVDSPTHLVMNSDMKLRLDQAVRAYGLSGIIQSSRDEFGKGVDSYKGYPILVLRKDNANQQILPFTEVSAGGGAAQCTSIYCVNFSDGNIMGLEQGPLEIRDLGEMMEKPVVRIRTEWVSSFAVLRGNAGARLRGITDAVVVE